MPIKIISGGQSGADIGALRAAKAMNVPTAGCIPKGFLTEDGPRPEYASLYGLEETETDEYPERTKLNVRDSDGVLWFGNPDSYGGRLTLKTAKLLSRPKKIADAETLSSHVAAWIVENKIQVLDVAGSRESKAPGMARRVELFMTAVLRRLA